MKKSDLTQGSIVKLRDGSICALVGDRFRDLENPSFIYLNAFDDDLLDKEDTCGKFDIVAVALSKESIYTDLWKGTIKWDWERIESRNHSQELKKLKEYEEAEKAGYILRCTECDSIAIDATVENNRFVFYCDKCRWTEKL